MILCGIGLTQAAEPQSQSIDISSRIVADFKIGSTQTRFGQLDYLGGLEMVSAQSRFGSISAFRFRPDHAHFVAVLDTGHWMTGQVRRDAQGRLSGLDDVVLTPMKNSKGRIFKTKGPMDAEGLALGQNEILVSFERDHRVDIYPDPGFETAAPHRSLSLLVPSRELRANGGFETIVFAPLQSALAGAPVIVAEKSIDAQGNLFAAILGGPLKGIFAVKRDTAFDVTDGVFLPNGNLLLLERRFGYINGIGMRLRLIPGHEIKPGALVDGAILLDADFGYQIDNMEGIDAFEADDGSTHILILSDDNQSILQRNLLLEFRLTQ